MPPFVLLKDPANYVPCADGNMLVDHELRDYWLYHFEHHFTGVVMMLALETYGEARRKNIEAARDELIAAVQRLKAKPDCMNGRLDLLILDEIRQDALIRHGVPDPFEKLKEKENAAMLPQYRHVIDELDSHTSEAEALLLAVEGVFAGNIYDLGAGATAKLFANSSPDFIEVRDQIARPWLVDHFDAFAARMLQGPPHKKAIFFLDNAGSDCLLGVIPFARLLAKRGTTVAIAANTLPALNDVTITELPGILEALSAQDPVLADLLSTRKIRVVDSGSGTPLIDLRQTTAALNAEAQDADLVLLEGMGRAQASNYQAKFKVDSVKMFMIKEQIAADRLGGKLFDTVLKFEPR